MRNLIGMFVILALTYIFSPVVHATTGVPAVPTNIINAPKAQFIGSMVTSIEGSIQKISPSVTHVNPQFKDCNACMNWLDNGTTATAKFTKTTTQSAWTSQGSLGFVGNCIDSQTGGICGVVE